MSVTYPQLQALEKLQSLTTQWRFAPCYPGHAHVDMYAAMAEIGGDVAIAYGMWMATPFRQRWKKQDRGLEIYAALQVRVNDLKEKLKREGASVIVHHDEVEYDAARDKRGRRRKR